MTNVQSHEDAVRLVADILAEEVSTSPEDLARIARDVVDALLGDPVATSHYDDAGNVTAITLTWPSDEARACIVARPILEHLVDLITRQRPQAEPACCDLHNRHCEPPADLCCHLCTEARHPEHPPGVACTWQQTDDEA